MNNYLERLSWYDQFWRLCLIFDFLLSVAGCFSHLSKILSTLIFYSTLSYLKRAKLFIKDSGMNTFMRIFQTTPVAPIIMHVICWSEVKGTSWKVVPPYSTMKSWRIKIPITIIINIVFIKKLEKTFSSVFLSFLALKKLNIWRNTNTLKKRARCCPFSGFQDSN